MFLNFYKCVSHLKDSDDETVVREWPVQAQQARAPGLGNGKVLLNQISRKIIYIYIVI